MVVAGEREACQNGQHRSLAHLLTHRRQVFRDLWFTCLIEMWNEKTEEVIGYYRL
jgi:hypothetical protein